MYGHISFQKKIRRILRGKEKKLKEEQTVKLWGSLILFIWEIQYQ